MARIRAGRIPMVGKRAGRAGGKWFLAPQPSRIEPFYLHEHWRADWEEFLTSSQVSFAQIPEPLQDFAARRLGPGVSLAQSETTHIFREVRLDPVALAIEYEIGPPAGEAVPQKKEVTHTRDSGRLPIKHGEPIARITLRLAADGDEAAQGTTVKALTADLMAEYIRLGLGPPHETSVRIYARGILRAFEKK